MATNLGTMYRKFMIKKFLYLLLIPFLVGCSKQEPKDPNKPTILVTIAPYAEFVERIAKGRVNVKILVPQGMNLHSFEPSPKLVGEAIGAEVWFRIDEPFEQKIARVMHEQNPNQVVVNLQEGIPLLGGDHVELSYCVGHSHDRDLHTWLSLKNAALQCQQITETLSRLLPEDGDFFRENYNNLAFDFQRIDREITEKLTPYKGDAILVSHPAFGYFCYDYQLLQLSVECEGKEPRPKDVERILQEANEYDIRCVFLQQGFNNKGAKLIGSQLRLPTYRIDPYAKDYLKNMQQIAEYIAK